MALLGGCASKPPAPIARVPADNPGLNQVRADIDSYIGRDVRWGGVISKVENRADQTWIELVRHKLRDNGRPRSKSLSDGRFIASFKRFVDPMVYEVGRPLTVVGTIEGKVRRPIGEYDYLFPIITVEGSYLWQPEADVSTPPYPYPWWYSHWYYDPWYPHHHHRYHHYH